MDITNDDQSGQGHNLSISGSDVYDELWFNIIESIPNVDFDDNLWFNIKLESKHAGLFSIVLLFDICGSLKYVFKPLRVKDY